MKKKMPNNGARILIGDIHGKFGFALYKDGLVKFDNDPKIWRYFDDFYGWSSYKELKRNLNKL